MSGPPPVSPAGDSDSTAGSDSIADTRTTRRRLLGSVAAVGVGLPLAGCGSTGPPSGDSGTDATESPSTGSPTSGTDAPADRGSAPSVVGPWPQARADAGNTGAVPGTGPLGAPSVRWAVASAGAVGVSVSLGDSVSVGADRDSDGASETGGAYAVAEDGRVAAVDLGSGETRWTAAAGTTPFAPAVGSGRVVVPERERLVVFDAATGERLRAVSVSGGIRHAPTVVGSRALVGTSSGGLVAVDLASGETRWQTGAPSQTYPPVVVDGVAYATARRWETAGDGETVAGDTDPTESAGVLVALDVGTGERRWAVGLDGRPTASPGYHDGAVYAGTHRGQVTAVDAESGDSRWRETVGDWVTHGPTAAADGVYVVVLGEGPVKLSTDGQVRWRSEADVGTAPVLADGVALFGAKDGVVAADREDGGIRWRGDTDAAVTADVRVAGGVAYAGDRYGTVVAFDAATGELRWRLPFRPKRMLGPVVGPRTVAGGSRDGGTYDLLATDGTEFPLVGSVGSPGRTPVFLENEPRSSRETLLSVAGDGTAARTRTADYGDAPATDLRPTPTPTATPEAGAPTATPTPHIDFPRPDERWAVALDVVPRSPVTYADGLAYVGTSEGIAAVDARDGRIRLRRALGAAVSGAPAAGDGRVVAATRDGRLVAMSVPDGSGDSTGGSSDSAGDGVSIGTDGDPSDSDPSAGTVRWEVALDGPVHSGPAVADGSVFVATETGDVVSYTLEGAERWTRALDGEFFGGVAVADKRVYVGTGDGAVLALARSDGSAVWRASAEGAVHVTPAVGGVGDSERATVYVGDHAGTLSAFETDTGDLRWRLPLGRWVDAPPAIGHGAVFVADQTGRVYAVVGRQ